MENGNITQAEAGGPAVFLNQIIGDTVTVKLNSGVVYKGWMFCSELGLC